MAAAADDAAGTAGRGGHDEAVERIFWLCILVLAAIRVCARGYFDTILTTQQTAGMFFILAFGMIVIWRAKMLVDFRQADGRGV